MIVLKNPLTAKRMNEVLNEFNMKPQELADLTGVSKSSISQYVNGSHAPSNISSSKMAKVFNVNPLWLMGFNVEKRKEISSSEADIDMALLQKFSLLNDRDKEIVMNLIDSMLKDKGVI